MGGDIANLPEIVRLAIMTADEREQGELITDFDETEDSPGISRSIQQSAITNDNSVVYFYDIIGTSLIEFDVTI